MNKFYSLNGVMVSMLLLLGVGVQRMFCFTPPLKKAKPTVEVSPQYAILPAENMARHIFEALTKKIDNEAFEDKLVCTDKPEVALELLLDWYKRFPLTFSKIKWYTPQDERADIQADFKYKLAAALQQSILSCLSLSSKTGIPAPTTLYGDASCTTGMILGGFSIISCLSKETLTTKHSITLNNKDLPMPEYNPENGVKKAFMGYLFNPLDKGGEFQAILQKILSAIPAKQRIAKEQFYHALIYGMISFMGSNFSIVEAYSGQGRADLLLSSNIGKVSGAQNCIIEFKYNCSAKEALDQIKSMDYSRYFRPGNVIAVGINIKGNPFEITCSKEVIEVKHQTITKTEKEVSGSVSWN